MKNITIRVSDLGLFFSGTTTMYLRGEGSIYVVYGRLALVEFSAKQQIYPVHTFRPICRHKPWTR